MQSFEAILLFCQASKIDDFIRLAIEWDVQDDGGGAAGWSFAVFGAAKHSAGEESVAWKGWWDGLFFATGGFGRVTGRGGARGIFDYRSS